MARTKYRSPRAGVLILPCIVAVSACGGTPSPVAQPAQPDIAAPRPVPVDERSSTTAPLPEDPPPPPPPVAAPMDPRQQQQTNDRLDRAMVDDCIAKLDAIVSGYEGIKTPTEDQTVSTAVSFSRTLNQQCGMKDRVESDQRFQGLLRRLAPLNNRMDAITKKKCRAIEAQMKAAHDQVARDRQACERNVCCQTCMGNGNEQMPCARHCGLGEHGAPFVTIVDLESQQRDWRCK